MRLTPRVAGFRLEYPAGFELECMAGFIGTRNQIGVFNFFQANNREGYRNGNRSKRKFNARNPVDTAVRTVPLHPGKNDIQGRVC